MINKKIKAKYGKFYTTNYKYILKDFENYKKNFKDKKIIEPFAGKGHLIKWLNQKNVEAYDLHAYQKIKKKDTLKNPPNYKNKWVVTNPPYLARNKSNDKTIFDLYQTNDLYKAFIITIIKDPPKGGILIIPLNFFCSVRESDIKLRQSFFSVFVINKLIIFQEKVFNDTTNTICAFQFVYKENNPKHIIPVIIYPNKIALQIKLESNNNWLYGGGIYSEFKNSNLVKRLVKHKIPENWYWSQLILFSIDTGGEKRIRLEYQKDIYIGTLTNRNMAGIICKKKIKNPKQIVNKFNYLIESKRKKYFSMFLPNYRESKDYIRKRIPFRLAYGIIQYLIG